MNLCEVCEKQEVHVRLGAERMCLDCYNARMAGELDVAATSYPRGVSIADAKGEVHEFQLRKRLDPAGIIMEAEETKPNGYAFQIYGDLDADQGQLLLQLIAKAERGMAETYITRGTFPNGQEYHSIENGRLIGRIEWDSEEEDAPLLIIDGKRYSWEQVGKMLLTYEGYQIKMELLDPSEEEE